MGNGQGDPSGSSKASPLVSMRGHSHSLYSRLLAQDLGRECLTMSLSFLNVQLWGLYCGPRAQLGFKGSGVGQAVRGGKKKETRGGVGKHIECINSDGEKR